MEGGRGGGGGSFAQGDTFLNDAKKMQVEWAKEFKKKKRPGRKNKNEATQSETAKTIEQRFEDGRISPVNTDMQSVRLISAICGASSSADGQMSPAHLERGSDAMVDISSGNETIDDSCETDDDSTSTSYYSDESNDSDVMVVESKSVGDAPAAAQVSAPASADAKVHLSTGATGNDGAGADASGKEVVGEGDGSTDHGSTKTSTMKRPAGKPVGEPVSKGRGNCMG